ncbi:MAG: hypothetical protein EON92_18995 [Burkholderiales bacterium]|nr:MAG: hypothetical protein EON92_18995 [Burkholderiales bacterium]
MNATANPKDAAGRAKLPLHLWPDSATYYGSVGFLEGQLKYGRLNWRATPVYASIYFAAAKRHLNDWMEGEDFTAEGGPHLGNALACIAILVDAHVNGTLIDDRNYVPNAGAKDAMMKQLVDCANKLKATFGDRAPKHWDARDNLQRPRPGEIIELDCSGNTFMAPVRHKPLSFR